VPVRGLALKNLRFALTGSSSKYLRHPTIKLKVGLTDTKGNRRLTGTAHQILIRRQRGRQAPSQLKDAFRTPSLGSWPNPMP
jgi:hypothetical protein